MELPVCAVFDKKSGLFDNPFTVRHVAEAVRQWDIVRKDPETKYGKNPEDFDLVNIAEFDVSKGAFKTLQPHRPLASGV